MAWVKIPREHHPILLAALPKDPRVRTVQMFGAICGKVNGRLFGGLFARSAMVRLDPEGQREALALDGAEPFDPMGNKRVMADTVLLPESVMDEPDELRRWLARAFTYTATLPPKQPQKKKPVAKQPQKKKRAVAKQAPATKAKVAAKKAAGKRASAKKARTKKAKAPAKAPAQKKAPARRTAARSR